MALARPVPGYNKSCAEGKKGNNKDTWFEHMYMIAANCNCCYRPLATIDGSRDGTWIHNCFVTKTDHCCFFVPKPV